MKKTVNQKFASAAAAQRQIHTPFQEDCEQVSCNLFNHSTSLTAAISHFLVT